MRCTGLSQSCSCMLCILLLVFPGDFRKEDCCIFQLSIVLAFEMFQNVKLGTETVSTSDYLSYPTQHEEVESLLAQIREQDDSRFIGQSFLPGTR